VTRDKLTKLLDYIMTVGTALLTAAVVLGAATCAHAVTTDNVRFTCHGILSDTNKVVADDDADYPTTCSFDDRVLKQALSVCHVGEWCEVQAIGATGNGGRNVVTKILKIRKQ
jgi:hypothetical protein